jgi:hypothetical protein
MRGRTAACLITAALAALAALVPASSALAAAPLGSGKTVAFGVTRSGSAGVSGGACGTRLQCFKDGVTDAAMITAPFVENAALVQINVAEPDLDVNFKLSGKQLLIPPDSDPNFNGKADYLEAVTKLSLGGGTCYTCALQAVERGFTGARADSPKVIVLAAERDNTFASTGFTSSGQPTGYPPATLASMADHFDADTVIRAFAVGGLTCAADPNHYGSLNETAAVTPGGTCTELASFEGLGPILADAVNSSGPSLPPPDTTSPAVTLTSPASNASISEDAALTFAGAAGTASGDEDSVKVDVWQGADSAGEPLQTLAATPSSGAYSVTSPPLAPGSYTARAEQRDAAGNVGHSASVPFTITSPEPPPPPPPSGSGSYAETVRADAPRGYWRLGEASGTVAAEDQHRADGTYLGGVVLGAAGALAADADTAARFDGGNDKLTVPDPAGGSLDFGTGDFTVEAWVKPSAGDERVIVVKRPSTGTEPYWALTVTDDPNHNGQVRAVYFDGASTRTAYSSKGTVDGAWHHVVVWYDRHTGITISVDGVSKATALAITGDVGNSGEVGIGKGPANGYFKGDIDEVALYDGLVPLQNIQAHAAAATAP